MIGLLLAVVLSGAAPPVWPDLRLTPGAVRPGVTVAQVCTPGYARSVRLVKAKTRRDVFAAYGLVPSGAYELDHLISLELGGDNSAGNLWPQAYAGVWGARKKDALENRLHWLVCRAGLTLPAAQRALRADWIAAWTRYVAQNGTK